MAMKPRAMKKKPMAMKRGGKKMMRGGMAKKPMAMKRGGKSKKMAGGGKSTLEKNLKKPSLADFKNAFRSASDSQLKPLLSKSMIRRMERIMKK